MATLAPSLRRLEAEVNRQFRGRDDWSDGWLGDDSHATRFSDHNPDGRGIVHAYDFDATMRHAMGPGPVGDYIAAHILAGCRSGRLRNVVNYVIYKRVIYSAPSYRAHRYTGDNPHDSHVHVSIHRTSTARNWSGGWGILVPVIDASRVEWAFSGHPSAAPDNLRRVQARLQAKGYLRTPYRHGFAGPKTRSAMRKWQVRNDYKADARPGFWQLVKLSGGHYRVVR